MAVYKNKTGQKVPVFATLSGEAKTGEAAKITAQISKDGGASGAVLDANPAEVDATNHPGVYLFDLTQEESNADLIILTAKSSTSGVTIRPVMIYTEPETRTANPASGGITSTSFSSGAITSTVIADDAITAAKFDETTAFPLKSADTGTTAVARVGADADTLETLSNQLDNVEGTTQGTDATVTSIDSAVATISTVADAVKVVTDYLNGMLEAGTGVLKKFTAEALEEAPTGGSTDVTELKQMLQAKGE